jgi:hypothetical protein
MLQPNYTDKDSKLFTGRNSYLDKLEKAISKDKVIALIAPSGFGRTSLLKQFAKKSGSFYIDLKKMGISPESFAVDMISTVCFLSLAKRPSELPDYQSIEKLKQLKLGKACAKILSAVENELQKIKPDQELLLKSAFMFLEEFAEESGKKLTIILNSCNELLKLNNFSQVKDAFGLFFDSIERNKSCSFILSSSNVNNMRNILKKFTPEVLEMSSFSLSETKELFGKIAGKADERIMKDVHELSAGIPLIIGSIAKRYVKEKADQTQKNIALVRYILISELATTSSPAYFYCSRLLAESLNRARGEALLKTILKAVSQNRPLRLTEIARLIYRSGPVTKSLIERLIEVDLIKKEGSTLDFANPVLKQWCRLMFNGIEFSETPDEKTLTEVGGMR